MRFLAFSALLVGAVSGLTANHFPADAEIIPAKETAALRSIGAHHQKYPDRRTVTIRASKNDTDDISADLLWGIKQANHGGRLLLQKGMTYVIGKKLDLSFLDDIEVQLEGEIKVNMLLKKGQRDDLTRIVHRRYRLLASQPLLL